MAVGEGRKDAQGRLWLMAVFTISLTWIVLGMSTTPVVYFKRVQVILCCFISVRMLKGKGEGQSCSEHRPGRVFTGSTWPVGGARPSLNRNTSVVLDTGGWKEAVMGDRAGPPLSSHCLSAPLGVCFVAGRGQGSGW